MVSLAERAFTPKNLRRAWQEVLDNDRADGELAAGVERFADGVDARLDTLHDELVAGTYRPADLHEVAIPKSDGSLRLLHVPAVRDRVVARAVLEVIMPSIDRSLSPASYAYRPGIGVADAVQAVVGLRDEGLDWALRTDINDCFPTVSVPRARARLVELIGDDDVLRVVDLLLQRWVAPHDGGRREPMRGLPQGCALSPVLANLVLDAIDRAAFAHGYPMVRYADDIVVVTASEAQARAALTCVAEAAKDLDMALGADKTEIMSFADGFAFVGEDFGPRYPVARHDLDVDEPDRRVLYVGLQGSRVRVASGRLIVESADEQRVLDVPKNHVCRIVCFGSVGVSAGARSWALDTGVDVVFASRRGAYQGALASGSASTRVGRLRAQLAVQGTDRALVLARAFVDAKVSKQRVLLQRFVRPDTLDILGPALDAMEHVLPLLPAATTTEEVMGIEGAAAAAYFPALGGILPEGLRFSVRSRQPPRDVANAALSFLYTVMLGECVTALWSAGLDPAIGLMHANDPNRPSLALDLMEEFRPYVVDQVVVEAARQRRLLPEHARAEKGSAIMLTKAGRDALLDGYERRMLTRTGGSLVDFRGTIRRHLYRQAQRLQSAINGSDEWTGLTWR